ncbi:MAG TPA: MucR family transcriptional regulator [Rhizomicrobium sp.]|jgi:predicted transcriptional regulator|nr:MucR family transcriptional regulator [Rhizomicrobium sp.]
MPDQKASPPEALTLIEMTAVVVSAYVSNNAVPANDLPAAIKSIHAALAAIAGGTVEGESPKPAVSIRKSVTLDYLICLEDGKKLTMLKRYLRSNYDMSPEEYRARWRLPADYPMVAPNYAAKRSELAKKSGLGHTPSVRARSKRRV